MQPIDQLFTSLQDPKNVEAQFSKTADLNILFISPMLTAAGLYKHILPALALRETGIVATAFTDIQKFNPTKRFKEYADIHLSSKEIIWADSIVFPFTTEPIYEFINTLRKLTGFVHDDDGGKIPKTKIIYHIDFNFLCLPENHPYKELFTKEAVNNIFSNIAACDKIIFSNRFLAAAIIEECGKRSIVVPQDKFGIMILSAHEKLQLADVPVNTHLDTTFLHLCIVVNDLQLHDLKSCSDNLRVLKSFHKEKFQITVFGCNKNKDEYKEIMKGIEHNCEAPVPITKFLSKLSIISPDLVLIPSDASAFSISSIDYKRFLDASLLNIPIISLRTNPMQDIINHGRDGFLFDEKTSLNEIMNTLIKNKTPLKIAGRNANLLVKSYFSFNKQNLQSLIDLIG